ncbi:MAG: hypothetical protein H6834_12425 [Planctomycetes bacterium]|nr:hypothetical protein [Planctomycetota bacterium]
MRLLTTTLLLAVLASPAMAQTTGIPGFNDLTINALGSGSTSVTTLTFVSPTTLNFQIQASGAGYPVVLMVSPFPASPFPTLPLLTCQGTQFHLRFPPTPIMLPGSTGGGGAWNLAVPVGIPATFSVQGLIIDPSCTALLLFTQAYDVIVL